MGGAQAKEAVQYFTDVACAEADPEEKEFVERLTRYKKDICFGAEYFGASLPVLRELVPLCVKTQRVRWLFSFCLQQLEHASCNYNQGHSDAFIATLHITEFVVRYAHQVSRGDAAQLLDIIMGKAPHGTDGATTMQWTSTEANKVCCALMDYCVSVPVTYATAEAHNGVVSLLLSMNSSALYHSTTFDGKHMDVFTEIMMSYEGLGAFIATLLKRLVEWGSGRLSPSPLLYRDGHQPSLRNMYNVFGNGKGNNSISCRESLGRHCAQLLAVLLAHLKGNGQNLAMEYIKKIENEDPVPFAALLTAFVNRLKVCPSLCIVLYVLVYDHPTFLHTTMTLHAKELLDVIQEVLHLSYIAATETGEGNMACNNSISSTHPTTTTLESCQVFIYREVLTPECVAQLLKDMVQFSYPFIGFMTSTLVLLFSQDQVLNRNMSDTIIEPRFKAGRFSGKMSIISLCVVVLAHGILRAMNERNEPLASVFVPSLSNLAPFIYDIDAYTSQQLIRLLVLIIRKLRRSSGLIQMDEKEVSLTTESTNREEAAEMKDDTESQMFLRQLKLLVEAVEAMLQGEDRQNDSLVYELLYNRSKLQEGISADSPCSHLAAAHAALVPLFRIADYYETELASVTSAESYQDILGVIRRAAREQTGSIPTVKNHSPTSVPARSAGSAPWRPREIFYVYEESLQSYDFFGPFVWSTLLCDAIYPGGLLWATDTTALEMFSQ
ncbi:putative Dyggve-Melchior-Clausen syndrome protein [Trypanosoma cruzi]|nr:putative Dyggve-Melchior-Clausen syndrome protein [Trypanosoma cruzi]